MVKVINNNLWSPVPWGWGCGGHHQCGGNSWMNNMLKYQFMFQMFGNMQNMFRSYATPPQQQGGFYPGLYLGGGGGGMPQQESYEDYLQKQQDAQDFAQLKSSYSEFKFSNIGGEYQASLKSDRTVRFSGSTPLELMDEMNAYIDSNPDAFKSKPAATSTTGTTGDDETTTRTSTGTDGSGEATTETSSSSSQSGVSSQDGTTSGSTRRRGEKPPENWPAATTWYKSHFTDKNKTASTALDLVNEISYEGYTVAFASDDKKKELADAIAKYNISMFDADGKVKQDADWTKLNLPNLGAMKTYATVKTKPTIKPMSVVNENGTYVFYNKNKQKISETEFANAYPKTYLSNVARINKTWDLDTLSLALSLYDKYVGGRKQNTMNIEKNVFKTFQHRTNNGKHELWCDYVGYRSGPNGGIYANHTWTFNSNKWTGSLSKLYDETNNLRNPKDRKYLTDEEFSQALR